MDNVASLAADDASL